MRQPRPSLSVSMMPKASLNCWMADWEKDSKMLAFLGILKVVLVWLVPKKESSGSPAALGAELTCCGWICSPPWLELFPVDSAG